MPPHPAKADEAQASLRLQLMVELLNAQSELAELLKALRQDGADAGVIASGEQQLLGLTGLQRQLAEGTMPLSALKQAISASVASATGLVQQGRAHVTLAREAEIAALHAASADAHRVTDNFIRDFFEKRIFDPYLQFASAREEQEYRERENARQKAIEKAQAENTPQGNLRAIELAQAQLEDAGAHGADRSPEYKPMLDQLIQSKTSLSAAIAPRQGKEIDSIVLSVSAPQQDHAELGSTLKSAGVVVADQSQTGHGVTIDAALAEALGRC